MDYCFMTDSNSDIPYTYIDEHKIPVVYMPYVLDGKESFADLGRGGVAKDFFDKMRQGAVPVTSLLPTPDYFDYFEPILKEQDLLFIAFSSQLSATLQNVYEAREELLKKYPERKFVVVDTLSISAIQTLLIYGAHKLYLEGKPIEEVAGWVEANRMHARCWLMVDDLKYLWRGGRITGTTAFFGTMMNLKPILAMGKEGKIVPADKAQGRQKALRMLAEKTAADIEDPENQTLIIIHGDVEDDAKRLEEFIRKLIPNIGGVTLTYIGPVIGTHCGPGTVAICFFGKERTI
ncbi:MAG: DegV family protein [Clostridia bacterium]|nr:DegV family protein [Clostridia bacterium]